jgi:hypothetical protein
VKTRKKDDGRGSVFATTLQKQKTVVTNFSTLSESKYGKEMVLLRYTIDDHKENDQNLTARDEEGPLRVMEENEFYNLAYGRGKASWKTIVYV